MDNKTKYNPEIHHRRSIRLKGYDYSQNGLYFITICTHNRECLFGEVIDKKMVLNDAGKIANECWLKIPEHFPHAVLHQHVIMPNHVHGIIELAATVAVGNENFAVQNAVVQNAVVQNAVVQNAVVQKRGRGSKF
jgi:putative transposase